MENRSRQPWQQPEIIQLSELILASYRHWLQSELIPPATTPELTAKNLFEAPFVVLAHNTDADPIYTYGNRSALELWERDWEELVQMPSRQSAESSQQAQLVRNQPRAANVSVLKMSYFGICWIVPRNIRVRLRYFLSGRF